MPSAMSSGSLSVGISALGSPWACIVYTAVRRSMGSGTAFLVPLQNGRKHTAAALSAASPLPSHCQ